MPDDWYVWYNNQETPKKEPVTYQPQTFNQQQMNLALMHTQPLYQPRKFSGVEDSWDAANKMRTNPISAPAQPMNYPAKALEQRYIQPIYQATRPLYAESQRLTAQANAANQVRVNNTYAQRLTAQAQRSVGNTSARASGDAWKAKYYQYFDQNRARLAESQRMTSQANAFLDANIAPPFTGAGGSGSDYGGYGGYYSYGGGGGGSYKPAPKPWYMSLTNWRI